MNKSLKTLLLAACICTTSISGIMSASTTAYAYTQLIASVQKVSIFKDTLAVGESAQLELTWGNGAHPDVTYFNCKRLDGEYADYYGFTFDLYREYYSTISSDFSWGFYNPDNPYGIYENDSDIVSFSNYKDIPLTALKPIGVQYWGYYKIEYTDCQKKSDSTDDAVFFQIDWSGLK